MQAKTVRDLFPVLKAKAVSGEGGKDDAMMMLAPGDPLRDTPEKCRAYANRIAGLLVQQEAIAGLRLAHAVAVEKRRQDIEAALRLLGDVPVAP